MTILHAIILGIVEGVTEFLPVSSTGHLILTANILGIAESDFLKSFEIAIQFGAILAVVVLYFKRLITDFKTWKKIIIAFIPTAIVGVLLYKIIKEFLFSSTAVIVWSLFLGGVALIVFELWQKGRQEVKEIEIHEISHAKAFLIGLVQSLAVIPGVSRSGATIVGGMLMGIHRRTIVEMSFLLAIPTMAAATGYDLVKSAHNFSFNEFYLLAIGFAVSFIVAMATVKWLMNFIKNNTFIFFGIYRIIAAFLFYILVIR